jgi:hypothetical protein
MYYSEIGDYGTWRIADGVVSATVSADYQACFIPIPKPFCFELTTLLSLLAR